MRINRLRLRQFRQHVDTEITFESGLTGIIGPNGVGKTTILEAIAWALYGGDTARGGNKTLRFTGAKASDPVSVELDFELGGNRYRVIRGLTMAELFLNDDEGAIANSAKSVSELLQQRLGMTRSEFFNTYFTGQKELAVMATLTSTERGQFLSRVLGYEKLRSAQELADLRRRDLRSEIAGVRSGMPDPAALAQQTLESETALAAAQSRLADLEIARSLVQVQLNQLAPQWQAAQRQRDQLQLLEADLRVTQIDLLAHQRNAERIAEELRHVDAAREQLEPLALQLSPFHDVGNQLTLMRELAVHEGRRAALQEQEQVMATELTELREQISRVSTAPALEEEVTLDLEARRREFEEADGTLELRRTEWVRDRQEAETRRNALAGQYRELKEQRDRLVALGENGTCPTCQRPLLDHYRQVLDVVDTQMETVTADGSYFRSRLEQLEAMPEEVAVLDTRRREVQAEVSVLEKKLARVQVGVQQLERVGRELATKRQRYDALVLSLAAIPGGYARERHTELEGEFERLAALSTQVNRLNTQIEREPSLRRESEGVARQLVTLSAKHEEILRQRAAVALTEESFNALREQHEIVSAELHAVTLSAMSATGATQAAAGALERARLSRDELAVTEQKLAVLDADRRLHEELHRAFGDIRTDLNFSMRPELSKLASGFLSDLTDARYTELELDDKYKIVVFDEEGSPKPVMSGGEEDLANLVLRLAISQMIAERAGQAFSLLVLDEIFGSLDDTRRHNVVELLRGLHDRFEQVILITHIESVRDGLDQVIEVHFDEDTGAASVRRVADAATDFSAVLSAGTAEA